MPPQAVRGEGYYVSLCPVAPMSLPLFCANMDSSAGRASPLYAGSSGGIIWPRAVLRSLVENLFILYPCKSNFVAMNSLRFKFILIVKCKCNVKCKITRSSTKLLRLLTVLLMLADTTWFIVKTISWRWINRNTSYISTTPECQLMRNRDGWQRHNQHLPLNRSTTCMLLRTVTLEIWRRSHLMYLRNYLYRGWGYAIRYVCLLFV